MGMTDLVWAINPEPFLPAIGKFLEVVGAASLAQWMVENPLITLGAFGVIVGGAMAASKS